MNRVQSCIDFFEILVKAYREGPLLSRVLLQRARKEQVLCIADVIVNTLEGNIPLPVSVQSELRRSKRILRKLSRVAQENNNNQNHHNQQDDQHKTIQTSTSAPSRKSQFRKVCIDHYKTVVTFLRICLPHLQRVLSSELSTSLSNQELGNRELGNRELSNRDLNNRELSPALDPALDSTLDPAQTQKSACVSEEEEEEEEEED